MKGRRKAEFIFVYHFVIMISLLLLFWNGEVAMAEDSVILEIRISYLRNLLFNKYDVELYLDNSFIDVMPYGEEYSTSVKIKPGNHRISFNKKGQDSLSYHDDIYITCNSYYATTIKTDRDAITILGSKFHAFPESILNCNGNKSYRTNATVNVRSKPSVKGEKLGTIESGSLVEVLQTNDGWAEIEYNGKQAFLSEKYIDVQSDYEVNGSTPIEVNAYNIDTIKEGDYILVTGKGSFYNSSKGKIKIDVDNWTCGIETVVENYSGEEYFLRADSIEPGEFEEQLINTPLLVLDGSDSFMYEGKYYDKCTVTILGYIERFGEVEGETWRYGMEIEDAILVNLKINESK